MCQWEVRLAQWNTKRRLEAYRKRGVHPPEKEVLRVVDVVRGNLEDLDDQCLELGDVVRLRHVVVEACTNRDASTYYVLWHTQGLT